MTVPLNEQGGEARRFQLRLPDEMLGRLALAAGARDLTISEFIRHACEIEMARMDIELAEAAGMAVLPAPGGGHLGGTGPPGGSRARPGPQGPNSGR